MKNRTKRSPYIVLTAPNGARVKVKSFKAWPEEIQIKIVFSSSKPKSKKISAKG